VKTSYELSKHLYSPTPGFRIHASYNHEHNEGFDGRGNSDSLDLADADNASQSDLNKVDTVERY
jgi:hypothetical protein